MGGDCKYGGTAETLKPDFVTITVLSTTSVPCYITTYVTDSTTITTTVYSTDIITSTVTEKGTVTVIKYQPTPVLKTTVFESVIQITQTATSVWLESEGSAFESTITGDTQTIGGGIDQGKKHGDVYDNGGGRKGNGGTTARISAAGAAAPGGSAWTHAAGGIGATAVGANLAFNTVGGWAGAANGNNNLAAGAAGATVNGNGVAVNWNAGQTRRDDISTVLIVFGAVISIVLFEVCHYLG